jgi:citrate lyase subunit beta/citryl-CoA lyase
MPASTPENSLLFVPGNRPERFAKALAAGAHAVIADLEDAVAPPDKQAARQAIAEAMTRPETAGLLVRINAFGTEWFDDDVAMCMDAGVGGVVLPKAEHGATIEALAASLGAHTAIYPLIESAQGFGNLDEIARAPSVRRLIFGTIDFQVDMGIDGDGEELLMFRSAMVLASRLAGILSPVDGVTVATDDPARLQAETERARRFGFGAKLCIHPRQVAGVNACFQPTQAQIDWARRVLAAAGGVDGAVVMVDGQMVDKPVLLNAASTLRRAGLAA